MRRVLEHHWYYPALSWLTVLLLPFSWLFRGLVALRIFLYRLHFKKITRFSVPIIVVGNITIGGTGKTPLVIWLARFLAAQGFRPGIVSRGVGGKKHSLPYWIGENADPKIVGDEAILLARRGRCPVVIGVDRVAAVKELVSRTNCNVVIADDGLQHYRLGRSIEIAVVDGERQLGNKKFLPAGPLRESPKRLNKVDFIVQQNAKQGKFVMQLQGNYLFSLQDKDKQMSIESLQNHTVHAVAGIGHPERFFTFLRAYGLQIIEHVFPDHYLYQAVDFNFADHLPILMTEKDAVKCEKFADERWWYVPVEAKLNDGFAEALLLKLKGVSSFPLQGHC